MNFAAEMKLQDFKLQEEQDTRLVQFGSTLFKIKCRASQGVREAVESDGARERKIQRDLKVRCFTQLCINIFGCFSLFSEGNSCDTVSSYSAQHST